MSEATDTKRDGVMKLSSAKDKLKEKERRENLAKLEQWKVSQYYIILIFIMCYYRKNNKLDS